MDETRVLTPAAQAALDAAGKPVRSDVPQIDVREFVACAGDVLDKRALAKRLAPVYVKDDLATGGITRAGLARLCDEAIDPSGNLLGYIREIVFQQPLISLGKSHD